MENIDTQSTLPSKEQIQSEPEGTEMCSEVPAPTEASWLTPIIELSQTGSKYSRENMHDIPDKPHNELELIYMTAPATSIPAMTPMIISAYYSTPEMRSPTMEVLWDKGKQHAGYQSPQEAPSSSQGSEQSTASRLDRISRDVKAIKTETRRWTEYAQDSEHDWESQVADQEISQQHIRMGHNCANHLK
jgi:hypothetical protein